MNKQFTLILMLVIIGPLCLFSCHKYVPGKPLYAPVYFLREFGETHKLFYFDIELNEMKHWRNITIETERAKSYPMTFSLDGQLMAVQYRTTNLMMFKKDELINNVSEKFHGFEIINFEKGQRLKIPLHKGVQYYGPGIITKNYYIFPVRKIPTLTNNEMSEFVKFVMNELPKDNDLFPIFRDSCIDLGDYINAFHCSVPKLYVYDFLTSQSSIVEYHNSLRSELIGILYLYSEDRNEIVLEDYDQILIYNIDKNKYRKHSIKYDNDIFFIYSLYEVYKNSVKKRNLIYKINKNRDGHIIDICPSNEYIILQYIDEEAEYQILYNLKNKTIKKIKVWDQEYINSLTLSQKYENIFAGRYLFVGWVKIDNLRQTAPK